jgi:hypothetical protein
MIEDEHAIGRGYRAWMLPVVMNIPFAVAYFADTKWVIASGLFVLFAMVHEIGGRLHDLCIRIRRTNLLLNDMRLDKSKNERT